MDTTKRCDCCSRQAKFQCARCHKGWYCSDACQKIGWYHHQHTCGGSFVGTKAEPADGRSIAPPPDVKSDEFKSNRARYQSIRAKLVKDHPGKYVVVDGNKDQIFESLADAMCKRPKNAYLGSLLDTTKIKSRAYVSYPNQVPAGGGRTVPVFPMEMKTWLHTVVAIPNNIAIVDTGADTTVLPLNVFDASIHWLLVDDDQVIHGEHIKTTTGIVRLFPGSLYGYPCTFIGTDNPNFDMPVHGRRENLDYRTFLFVGEDAHQRNEVDPYDGSNNMCGPGTITVLDNHYGQAVLW